jgi:hypothetical protein
MAIRRSVPTAPPGRTLASRRSPMKAVAAVPCRSLRGSARGGVEGCEWMLLSRENMLLLSA